MTTVNPLHRAQGFDTDRYRLPHPRKNRERFVGQQVCRVAQSFFPSFNALAWASLVGRITRAVIYPRPDEAFRFEFPQAGLVPELGDISTEALGQNATALRFRLGWMALRDVRLARVMPQLCDGSTAFLDWLKLQPLETLQTWASMFVSDWAVRGNQGQAAFRLARLKPMPLLVLWPYHCWRVAQLPAIQADRSSVEDAYILGFLACQLRRLLSDEERFPPYTASETAHDLDVTLPALQKKLQVAAEFGTTFTASLFEEAEATASALLASYAAQPAPPEHTTSLIRVGPDCPVCAGRPGWRAEPGCPMVPPFQVGCTCELLFDSEYLPLLEADFVPDLWHWSARVRPQSWRWFPLRRVLLATAERQMLRAAVDHLKWTNATELLTGSPGKQLYYAPLDTDGVANQLRYEKSKKHTPRSGPVGTLQAAVVEILQSKAPGWVSTNAIAAAAQRQLQLEFSSESEKRKWGKGSVGRVLRNLVKRCEVTRRETGAWRYQVEWRLTTETEREDAPRKRRMVSIPLTLALPTSR